MNDRRRRQARAAGILYLVTHVTSVTAVFAYERDSIVAGVTLEFILALGCVGTGVLLWALLSADGPARAGTFALLRTLEASVIVAGTLPMLATTWLSGEHSTAVEAATEVHTASFLLGQGLVISVNTIVLGCLLRDSARVPRALAWLAIVGGAVVLTSNSAQLWGAIPLNGTLAGAAAVPIFAFEIWFAVYLISKGLRPHAPATEQPAAAALEEARP